MHAVIFNDNLEIKRRTMGAYKIANCLERRGWRVTVVDWVSAWNEWQLRTYLSDICTEETQLFGVSYTWLEPDYARRLIQGLKEFRPDVKIMLG